MSENQLKIQGTEFKWREEKTRQKLWGGEHMQAIYELERMGKDEAYYGENVSTPTKRCSVCKFYVEDQNPNCLRLYGRVNPNKGRCLSFIEKGQDILH